MKNFIKKLPLQITEALDLSSVAHAQIQTAPRNGFHNIWLLGMGGSAFGGEIVKNYIADKSRLPFLIHRSYQLPAAVTYNSLVIVSSYSGNTEETLTAAKTALERNAYIVCIASGGQLKEWAQNYRLPFIELPQGYPPRAACAFSIVQQLQILSDVGVLMDVNGELKAVIDFLKDEQEECRNVAKKIAKMIKGTIPVIYAGDAMDAIAIRLRQQINENAKSLCWHHLTPEMNHNEMVGWEFPRKFLKRTSVLVLRSNFDHARVQLRHDICNEILSEKSPLVINIEAIGKTRLQQLFYMLHLSDWVSYYLAKAYKVNPLPVKVIDKLKSALENK